MKKLSKIFRSISGDAVSLKQTAGTYNLDTALVNQLDNEIEIASKNITKEIKGELDSIAVKRKHSFNSSLRGAKRQSNPSTDLSKSKEYVMDRFANARDDVYISMEQARSEIIESKRMRGVEESIFRYQIAKDYESIELHDTLPLIFKEICTVSTPKPPSFHKKSIIKQVGNELNELKENLLNPDAYHNLLRLIINKLTNPSFGQKADGKSLDTDEVDFKSDYQEELQESSTEQGDADADNTQEQDANSSPSPADLSERENPPEDAMAGEAQSNAPEEAEESIIIPYSIFSTKYDVIERAGNLADRDELHKLRKKIDEDLAEIEDVTRILTRKLKSRLMARIKRSFKFNQEDGVLDGRKLASVIINPDNPYIYKREHEDNQKEVIVSILLDNSGSMRGRPIRMSAMSSDILARALEASGISCEILGFTTREWKGGRCLKDYSEVGKTPAGRLNELLHIIYKDSHESYKKSRNNLGLMLKDGILKENIDGEALEWAHGRLTKLHHPRKILIVISDGAPVDDATLANNEKGFLDTHLRSVIKSIESKGEIELKAIGIGHDVTAYYKDAITIDNITTLPHTLLNEIIELF